MKDIKLPFSFNSSLEDFTRDLTAAALRDELEPVICRDSEIDRVITQRTEGGFRLFTPDTVERVRFIKQVQELGFSLDEIGELLATGGASECRRVRDHLKVKLSEVDERNRLMQGFRITLARHLAACERELSRHADDAVCPVLINIPRADSGKKKKR